MDWILLVAMAALLGFMFWSSRRRAARLKTEQETKARQMVPGVKVLLQGGLYGTLVSYDPDDLSKSAEVELAPGAVVEVHSQAILRVVEPEAEEISDEEFDEAQEDQAEYQADVAEGIITPVEGRPVADGDDKPKA
ncbi:preprotein translocase subunit YajC [uncultured Microbacterium sp.]|uniref:preprotein translocase subunit YajC n=1 Tax=uncultured Microbacterium sp. TaxID=191216 RepID=UPI00262AA28F|nr:preprotein translocase subunit YajC [uncultured Microbacterium sp.]